MNKLKSISFLDTINYKIGYQLYLFIRNNKNHSHLIIYGGKKSGKSHLVQSLFRELYDGEPILNNNEHFRSSNACYIYIWQFINLNEIDTK